MAPPCYADLGKQARDLFSKNYRKPGVRLGLKSRRQRISLLFIDFGLVKLDVKTRTPKGVEFTVNGNSNNDTGRVNASLETKYLFRDFGLTVKEKWDTDNTLAAEATFEDQLMKGSKLGVLATFAPQSGKKTGTLKSSLKGENFNANTDVDYDYAGPILHSALVLG